MFWTFVIAALMATGKLACFSLWRQNRMGALFREKCADECCFMGFLNFLHIYVAISCCGGSSGAVNGHMVDYFIVSFVIKHIFEPFNNLL